MNKDYYYKNSIYPIEICSEKLTKELLKEKLLMVASRQSTEDAVNTIFTATNDVEFEKYYQNMLSVMETYGYDITCLEDMTNIVKDKQLMLGMYLWDYSEKNRPMNSVLFEKQLKHYFELLIEKKIEGVVFCSSTIGDAPLKTNEILKSYIEKMGDTEIEDMS